MARAPKSVMVDVVPNIVEAVVQRFTLEPGEVVALTFPGAFTHDVAMRIQAEWAKRFPENPCVVITSGGHVSGILRAGAV